MKPRSGGPEQDDPCGRRPQRGTADHASKKERAGREYDNESNRLDRGHIRTESTRLATSCVLDNAWAEHGWPGKA